MATKGPNPVWISARKKVNQSSPRTLASAGTPCAVPSACLDAGGSAKAPMPRRASGPPSSSSAIVDSSFSPAPQGNYGVGFRPNAPCIGLPSLYALVPRAQPGRYGCKLNLCRRNSIGLKTAVLRIIRKFRLFVIGTLFQMYSCAASSRSQARTVVRLAVIHRGSLRDDSGGIDVADGPVIDDVIAPLHRRCNSWQLVQFSHVVREVRIIGDALPVAFEKREVSHVEANKRREQAPVSFCQLPPDQITLTPEPGLKLIQRRKQRII